ncbi:MAG: anthranilate synthase component I [Lentisphaerae bacterium]|nr:anthranilate synthase component I [Lentisphaerota bacterium]
MIYPCKEDFVSLAGEYDLVPVYKEILADIETPVSVLQRFADRENVFLLESMEGGEKWGRYSFIGIDPELLLDVGHESGSTGKLEELRKIYGNLRVAGIEGLPRFFGGAVGYIGYEAMVEFEKMPVPRRSDLVVPRSRFLKADRIVVFDNIRHTMKVVACVRPSQHESVEAAYDQAIRQIEETSAVLCEPVPAGPVAKREHVDFESNMTMDEYIGIVNRAKDYIYAGDIIQVVLSQRFSARTDLSAVQLYRALRLLNPSPYTFFLKTGDETLVGSSPEVMVRLTGSRVELRPIAGTRPRGSNEQEDRMLADELLSDEKEKAEHVMLVDLGRNDIGRIAENGSVNVTDYMVVERYSHVMHMVSHVEGILRQGLDAYDVIRATFPAGTLTGAPKIRAMEIIHELEKSPRGAYGGAIGYISYSGNMDLAITIRTLEVGRGIVSVQAGAGIVYDSDPQKEYEETCHKARGMQKAVEMAADGLEVRRQQIGDSR